MAPDGFPQPAASSDDAEPTTVIRLGRGARGVRGIIVRVGLDDADLGGASDGDLERRLLEIGFVEGARVEIIHEGLIGRDPIAVRLDDMRVALRRREADAIFVRLTGERATGGDGER